MIIKAKTGYLDLNLKEVWRFRDLVYMFVKRDFVTVHKQTVLGPLWYFILPLFTTVVFTIVFGRVAQIPTDDLPPFLFYMSGNVVWAYFAACITTTAGTFNTNKALFGKVYFPRLIMPITAVISNLILSGIQLVLFLGFYFYFILKGAPISPQVSVFLFPLLVLQMAMFGAGAGLIISSVTVKYRDLHFALAPLIQLWMYASPIVYPLSLVSDRLKPFYILNPMAVIIEGFRYMFLGSGELNPGYICTSWAVTIAVFIAGILVFNKVEKTFVDTI